MHFSAMSFQEVGSLELFSAHDTIVNSIHVDGINVSEEVPPASRFQTTSFTPEQALRITGVIISEVCKQSKEQAQ